jgi:FMN-dependent NADH-azoreductase
LSLFDRGVWKIFTTKYKIIIDKKMKNKDGSGRLKTYIDVIQVKEVINEHPR